MSLLWESLRTTCLGQSTVRLPHQSADWFAMTGERSRLPHQSVDWFAMTGRGAAALPSLVGKVAHAKRVTDELSSRFRKQLCPDEQKNHSKLGRIIQRKRCVIWTRRDSPVSLCSTAPL